MNVIPNILLLMAGSAIVSIALTDNNYLGYIGVGIFFIFLPLVVGND